MKGAGAARLGSVVPLYRGEVLKLVFTGWPTADAHGHATGDQVLKLVAARLSESLSAAT